MGRRDRFPLLAKCLEVCTRLNHLNLSRNDLGAESLNVVLSALLKNRKHRLETLKLASNAIGGGGVGGAAIIASFIEFSTRAAKEKRAKLRRLDLSANSLGDGGVRTIMMGLAFSTITHLHLSENSIGDAAVSHIVAGLEKMRQIETLDLSFNDVGPVGGTALAACVGNKHPTLSRLDLSWNKLGNKGATAFAVCLKRGTGALGEVNLASNNIGDAGGSAFVGAVAEAARGGLRVLRLDNNAFSSPVGRALLRAAAAASDSVGGRFRMGRLGSFAMAKHLDPRHRGATAASSSSAAGASSRPSKTSSDWRNHEDGGGIGGGDSRGGSRGGPRASHTAGGGGAPLRSSMSRGGARGDGDGKASKDKGTVGFAEDWGFKT